MENIGRKIAIMAEMKEVKFRKNTTKGRKKMPSTSNDLRRFIGRKRHFEQTDSPPVKFGRAA